MSGCLTQAAVPMKVTKPSKEEGEWQVFFPGRTTGFLFTVAMLLCLILTVLIWNTVYLPSIMSEENKQSHLLVDKEVVDFIEQKPKLIQRSQKIDHERAAWVKIVKQPENFPKDVKEDVAESLTSMKETFQKRNEALVVSQKQKKYQKPLNKMLFHEKSSENDTNQDNEGFIVGIKLLRRMIPSTRKLEHNFQDAKYANNAGDVSKSEYEPKPLNLDKSKEQMQKSGIRVKTEVTDKSTTEKTHGIPTVINRSIIPSMDVTRPKAVEHLRVKRLAGLLSQIKKLSADKETKTNGTVTKNLSGNIHLQHQGNHGFGEGLRSGMLKGMEAVASMANDKKEFMHNTQQVMLQKNEEINTQHGIRPTESSSSQTNRTSANNQMKSNLSGNIQLQQQGNHGFGKGLTLETLKGMEAVASIANDKKEFMHNIQQAMIQKNEEINGRHRIRPTGSSPSQRNQTSANNKVKSNLSGNIQLQQQGKHELEKGLTLETLKGMEAVASIANDKKEFMHNIQQAMLQKKDEEINGQHRIRPTESSNQTSANNKVKSNLSVNIQLQQGSHELGKGLTLEMLKGMEAVASIINDKKEFMHNIQQAIIQKNEEINTQHGIRPTESSSSQTNQTSANNKVKSNLSGNTQLQQQGNHELRKSLTLEASKGTETAASIVHVHPQYEKGFTQNKQQVMVQENIETNRQHEIKPMGSRLSHTNQTPVDTEMEINGRVKANLSGNIQIQNQGNHKLGESLSLEASQGTVEVASTTHAHPPHKKEFMHGTQQETIQNVEISRQHGLRPVESSFSHTNQTPVDKEMETNGTVEVNLSGNNQLQHQGTQELGKSPILEASQGTEAAKVSQEIADISSKIPHGISDLLFPKIQQPNDEGSISDDPQPKTDHEQYFITSPYPTLDFNYHKKNSEQFPTNFQKQTEHSKSNEQDNIFSPALLEGDTKIQLFQTDVPEPEDDLGIQKDTTAVNGIQALANENVRAEPISEKTTSNTAQNIFDNNKFSTINNQSHQKTEIFSHTLPQEMNVSYILHDHTSQPSDQYPRKDAEDASHIQLAVNQQPHQEVKDLSHISRPSDHQPQIKVEDVSQLPQASVELSHSEMEDLSHRGPQTNNQDLNISQHDSKIFEPFVANNKESTNTGTEFVANFKDKATETSVTRKVSEDSEAKLIIDKPCSGNVEAELTVTKENQGNANIAIVNKQIHENAGNTFAANKVESMLVTNQKASGNIVTEGDISKLDSGDRAIELGITEKIPESLEAKLAISKTFSERMGDEITANKHGQNTNFPKSSLPTTPQRPGHLSSDPQTLTLSKEIIITDTNRESIDLNHSSSYKPQVNVHDPNLQIRQSDELIENKEKSKSAETKFITNKQETGNPRTEFVTSKYSANKATESDIIEKIPDTSETGVVTNKINFENMATESGITEKVLDNSGTGVVTSKIDLENIATELDDVGKSLESLESKMATNKQFSGSAEAESITNKTQKNTNIHLDSDTLALLKEVMISDTARRFNLNHFLHKPQENTPDSKIQTGQLDGLVLNTAESKSTVCITNKQETGNPRTEFVTSKYSAGKSIQLGITDKVPDNSRTGVVSSKHGFENTATELNVAGKPSKSSESKIAINEPFSGSAEAEFITNENQQNTNILHFSTQTVSQDTTKNVLGNSGTRVVTSKHDFENIVTESDVSEKPLESSDSKIAIDELFSGSAEAEFITNENQQKTNVLYLSTPTVPQRTAKNVLDNSGSRVVTSKHDFENIATESDIAEKPLESSESKIAINKPFSGNAEAEFVINKNQQNTNVGDSSTSTVAQNSGHTNLDTHTLPLLKEMVISDTAAKKSDLNNFSHNRPQENVQDSNIESGKLDQLVENKEESKSMEAEFITKQAAENPGTEFVTGKLHPASDLGVSREIPEGSVAKLAIDKTFSGNLGAEFIANKGNQGKTDIVPANKEIYGTAFTANKTEPILVANKQVSGSIAAQVVVNKPEPGDTAMGLDTTGKASENLRANVAIKKNFSGNLGAELITNVEKVGNVEDKFVVGKPEHGSVGVGFMVSKQVPLNTGTGLNINKQEHVNVEAEFTNKQEPGNGGTEFTFAQKPGNAQSGSVANVLKVENIAGPENTGTSSKNFNQQAEFGIGKKIAFNLEKELGSQHMPLTNVGDRVKNHGPNIVTSIIGTSGIDKEKTTNSDKRLDQNQMAGRSSASSDEQSGSGIAFQSALSGSIQIPVKGSNVRDTEQVQQSRNTKAASINFDVSIDKRNLSGNRQQASNDRGKISDAGKGFLTGTLNSNRQESGNEGSSSGARTRGSGHRSAITLNSQKIVGGRISSAGIQFG